MVFYNDFAQLPHSASAHVLHSAAGASTPNLIVKEFRHQYHHYGGRGRVVLPKTPLCTLQSYNEDDVNNNDLSEVSFNAEEG